MQKEAEESLIKSAAKGDHQAFRALVEFHQAFAYSLAHRYTNDEEETEDITQEAFIKIWKNLHKYDPTFPFKAWLAKIVSNLCLDHLKSARRKHEWGKTKADETLMVADHHHPGHQLEAAELKTIVAQLAEHLTEQQRAVFVLRDLEMMSTEEVCQALSMSPGNMKSNLYYARLKIKQGLAAFYKS